MRRTIIIFTILLAAGCADFNPDLTGLDAGTETETADGTGDESDTDSDSATSTSGPDMGSTGDGDGDRDTEMGTGDETDTGEPNYCGDGMVGDDEACDGLDGVPLCEGTGEMSCVNGCMEISTTGCDDMGLDPALDVPAQGAPCEDIGRSTDCPSGAETCRLATPDKGICETCDAQDGCKSIGQACEASYDCDLTQTCYAGFVVMMCELGNPGCGQQTCTAVGHPTHGVCL